MSLNQQCNGTVTNPNQWCQWGRGSLLKEVLCCMIEVTQPLNELTGNANQRTLCYIHTIWLMLPIFTVYSELVRSNVWGGGLQDAPQGPRLRFNATASLNGMIQPGGTHHHLLERLLFLSNHLVSNVFFFSAFCTTHCELRHSLQLDEQCKHCSSRCMRSCCA